MSGSSKTHIVILGGDISGPMAAAFLSRYLPRTHFDLTFLCPKDLEKPELFIHLPPNLKRLHRDLKVKEQDFIKATSASFSLGSVISAETQSFIPFGPLGPILQDTTFHHVVGRCTPEKLYDLNLAACLMRDDKFLLPKTSGHILLSGFDYGYQLDVLAYAKLLTDKAKDLGCDVIEGSHANVDIQDGLIRRVKLENGEFLKGDIFIDASGRGHLAGHNNDWCRSENFPTHYTASEALVRDQPIPTASVSYYQDGHWSVEHQTQTHKTTLAFSDQGDEFSAGWLARPWKKNMLSVGTSSFLMPPMEGWNIRLIYEQLKRFIEFLPIGDISPALSDEYNRLSDERLHRVMGYAVLRHGLLGAKPQMKAEMWSDAIYKYHYFKSRGGIAAMDQDEDFSDQWTAMLLGCYGWPDKHNAMALEADGATLKAELDNIDMAIRHIVNQAPLQQEFLRKHGLIPEALT